MQVIHTRACDSYRQMKHALSVLCTTQAGEVLRQLRGKLNISKELREIERDVQLSKVGWCRVTLFLLPVSVLMSFYILV